MTENATRWRKRSRILGDASQLGPLTRNQKFSGVRAQAGKESNRHGQTSEHLLVNNVGHAWAANNTKGS